MCRLFYNKQGRNKFYIIGNGFDLFHQIPSAYSDFKEFVRHEDSDLFNELEYYFNDELWSDFEEMLAYIDADKIVDDATNYLQSYGVDDWSDAYHHDYQYEIDRALSVITDQLRKCFLKWVLQLEIPSQPVLNVSRASRFLNFNYTPTLEKAYKIKPSNILYVHGRAVNENSLLILGHSRQHTLQSSFSKENDEDTDVRVAQGNQLLDQYFINTYKNTKQIISENEKYFQSLKKINEVYVLGHSLSVVDRKYFEKIVSSIEQSAKWHVSYNSDNSKSTRINFLINLGVSELRIKAIKLDYLKNEHL